MREGVKYMKLNELLSDNYVYAYVLYYFGIEFFEKEDKTLEEVCREKGLEVRKVINSFNDLAKSELQQKIELEKYPIDLIVEYLKHTHHIFIKQRLPYIAYLIEKIRISPRTESIIKDLRISFPLFIEDFIKHIYQEEDTIFAHVVYLRKAKIEMSGLYEVYSRLQRMDLTETAIEHEAHEDDEMLEIRKMTGNYKLLGNIAYDVLMKELIAFDKELAIHAKVENEIFFPKAMMLEAEVNAMVQEKSLFN